jgi:hypothetical protein
MIECQAMLADLLFIIVYRKIWLTDNFRRFILLLLKSHWHIHEAHFRLMSDRGCLPVPLFFAKRKGHFSEMLILILRFFFSVLLAIVWKSTCVFEGFKLPFS